MMDDWYKIDDAFCIFNEKNRYDKCISDHKGGNILSYSEFKNTDPFYLSDLQSQKQKGIRDAVRDFSNKYKTGPTKAKIVYQEIHQNILKQIVVLIFQMVLI